MFKVEYNGECYDVLKTLYDELGRITSTGAKFVLGNSETRQIVCVNVEDCKYIVDKKKRNLNE